MTRHALRMPYCGRSCLVSIAAAVFAAPAHAVATTSASSDGSCWQRQARGRWVQRWAGLPDPYAALTVAPDRAAVASYQQNHSLCAVPAHRSRPQGCFTSAQRWEWAAHTGHVRLPLVNRTSFCHVMEKHSWHSLVFVGDSLMFDMAQSMWSLLGLANLPRYHPADTMTQGSLPCNHGNFALRIAPRLNTLGQGGLDSGALSRALKAISEADVSILSVGAHYSPVKLNGMGMNESAAFKADMHALAEALPGASFTGTRRRRLIWRSTPPGHPRCIERTAHGCRFGSQGRPFCEWASADGSPPALDSVPIGTRNADAHTHGSIHASAAAQLASAEVDASTDRFGWDNFPDFDALARHLLQPLGVAYLDVVPMSAPRADAHTGMRSGLGKNAPDCLHWALPGVPDWWNALLLGALLDCG